MELAPRALEDPAWEAMDEPLRTNARRTLRALVDRFDGVAVGVAPLVRHLIDASEMGHRSTLEAITALVAHGLVDERTHGERPVFWVRDRFVTEPEPAPEPLHPRRRPHPRRNGATPGAGTTIS